MSAPRGRKIPGMPPANVNDHAAHGVHGHWLPGFSSRDRKKEKKYILISMDLVNGNRYMHFQIREQLPSLMSLGPNSLVGVVYLVSFTLIKVLNP